MSLTTSLATAVVTPTLTTTFMPSNTACTENRLTMLLNREYEIWMNEILPVPGTTMTDCYPTQYIQSYLEHAGGITQGAFQALVCPQSYSAVGPFTSNYIACCPSGYKFTNPKSIIISSRPAFGGTCYTPIDMATPVIVTAYGSSGVTATSVWKASDINAAAYASPYEGFAFGVAQVPSITPAPTSTSGGGTAGVGQSHTVIAGAGPTFIPSSVSAKVGDTIVFEFSSGNHTITQSSFDKPCDKLPNGFDSEYTGNSATRISLAVNVPTAQFFYSKQSSDCKEGMVFVLNPTSSQSESAFRTLAISQTEGTSSELSTGAIAGIAIASVAGVGILGLLALLFLRRKKQHQAALAEKYGDEDHLSKSGTTSPTIGYAVSPNNISEAEGAPSVPPKGEVGELHNMSSPNELGSLPTELGLSPTELAGSSVVEMSAENATHHEANMSEKDDAREHMRNASPTTTVATWGYEPGNERAEIMFPESSPRHSQRTWGDRPSKSNGWV